MFLQIYYPLVKLFITVNGFSKKKTKEFAGYFDILDFICTQRIPHIQGDISIVGDDANTSVGTGVRTNSAVMNK